MAQLYSGCDEEYRLNPSGNINVPPGATDLFCNGPCLAETQLVLSCINNLLSNFIFYNKATMPEVRSALNGGCSYTPQRGSMHVVCASSGFILLACVLSLSLSGNGVSVCVGNFNVGDYMGLTSSAHRLPNLIGFYTSMLITAYCFYLI